MSRSFYLFRLQQVDTHIMRCRTRLTELESLLAEDSERAAAQAALSQTEAEHDAAQKTLRAAEEATRSQRIKIEQAENHLYSGKVRNPKELQDLQQEAAAHRRHLETLEERQLESMLAFDETEAAAGAARLRLEQVTARLIEERAALSGEHGRLSDELQQLQSERVVAWNSVTAEDRAIYQRVGAKRGGIAVAEATGKFCAACGTNLNAVLYQSARSPNQLVYCDTCGRVLYAG